MALAAALAFCALSGAVYAFNDVRDAADDRAHPTKCQRPVAAGHLSERTALFTAAGLSLLALGGSLAIDWRLAIVAAAYLANNLLYTLILKRVAFVDVSSIAAGFLLRVVAGAYAIEVPVSQWLLVCTGLLASLLGVGKRMHELLQATRLGRAATTTRAALAGYRVGLLKWLLPLLGVATCAAYAMYARDSETVSKFKTDDLIWTTPFCVLGIGRFWYLAVRRGNPHSPTEQILRDWPFLTNMAAWSAAVIVIIYWW